MKNPRKISLLSTLLVALLLVVAIGSGTQRTALADADDLFISEYIEGSSFNKAIEIYNGTGSAVDLTAGGYSLELYSNGSASVSQSVALTGMVADGDVYVVSHGSAGTAISDVTDLVSSSVVNFNGDDAVVLRKGADVIDAFGEVGFDPGSQWSSGGVSTQNNTLRRMSTICAGDTTADDEFDPSVEWQAFGEDNFEDIGAHTADCSSAPAALVINEVLASTVGTDVEYVELYAAPGTTLEGLSFIYVESNDGASLGTIDFRYDFGAGEAIGDNGFYLLGTTAGLQSNYGVTPNVEIVVNSLENSSATIALVETASLTGSSVSGSEAVIDTVALTDADPSTFFFGAPVLGPDGDFLPAGARRVVDGVDTDTVDDWVIADFDLGPANTPTAGTFSGGGTIEDVIINEIDADTPGSDALEFVELYDGGVGNTALDGLVVVFFNGSNDLSYASYDLDGYSTDANGYFLLGNPGVTPAPSITFGGDGLQNGQDAVALYIADGADFPSGTGVTTDGLLDAIVYDTNDADDPGLLVLLNAGQPQVNEGANNSAEESSQRCPNGEGGGRNTDTYTQAAPTPGAENDCGNGGGGEIGMCYDPVTHYIHEVQGSGDATPLLGQTVIVEGVVVGDFQNNGQSDNGDLNGFHVQEEDGDADADASTSEGIFVYTPGSPVDVSVGDVVRIRGTADEFSGLTQLTNTDILVCASGETVTPATITLPVDDVSDLEAYEGMSVIFTQDLYISEFFNFDRFGEIVLSSERHWQPTAVYEPGSPEAAAYADFITRSRITLDDGRGTQNPDPAIHPNGAEFDLNNLFRGGDIVRNVTGVMDYAFGLYRIQPTAGADYEEANPRTAAPEDVGGDIQVASFNVLNYFTTLNQSGNLCGPPGFEQECRGADTAEELARQRAKIVAAIAAMDADVVGLIEIQNDEGASTADLVDGLNDMLGAGTYAYVDTGYVGTDAIKQAFIYQPASVTPVSDYAVLDTPEFIDPNDTGSPKNRPVLAQTFMDNGNGGLVTVAVNHLKSKGSECGAGDDDPQQGNCNLTRTLSAQLMADWLATDPTDSGSDNVLIIGDLNAYDKEDPIDVLLANGYTDLVYAFEGEYAYSYVFDGQLGYLDHALANASLLPQITGATIWNINADEADLIDYDMSFKQDAQDAIWAPDPYRSSDHDPVIVGLTLIQPNQAPVCDGAMPSIVSIWPPNHKFVSIDILGVVDPDGDDVTITIDSIFQDEVVEGPGNKSNVDAMGVGTSTAEVRAERFAGNGRVYHIFFTATDSSGASCSGVVQVSVPKSRHMAALDDGPLFDSTVVSE